VKQEPQPARAENPRPSGRGEVNLRGRRARRHPYLGRAERDSRRKAGMPALHPEHVACGPPDSLAAIQRELWPDCEWTEVIEDFWRERGWRG